jgi:hypothetical protein
MGRRIAIVWSAWVLDRWGMRLPSPAIEAVARQLIRVG